MLVIAMPGNPSAAGTDDKTDCLDSVGGGMIPDKSLVASSLPATGMFSITGYPWLCSKITKHVPIGK
jgi:hypothetical protein